jgi:hypothetical protein
VARRVRLQGWVAVVSDGPGARDLSRRTGNHGTNPEVILSFRGFLPHFVDAAHRSAAGRSRRLDAVAKAVPVLPSVALEATPYGVPTCGEDTRYDSRPTGRLQLLIG